MGITGVNEEYLQGSIHNPAQYQKTYYFLYPHPGGGGGTAKYGLYRYVPL